MLHRILSVYLRDISKAVQQLQDMYVERYEEEILTPERINLRLRIRFSNGYLLEVNEAVIVETGKLQHLGYRHHFQDKDNTLIFHYDDTPHFPKLKSFPHHKHQRHDVIDSVKPSVTELLEEAQRLIQENRK